MKPITAAVGAAILALSVNVAGASAQNNMGAADSPLSNPSTVVKSFSVQSVGPVLNELGVPWQVSQLDNGTQFIVAASGSMQFILFFTVCNGADCMGMQAVTFFTGANANPQTVQAFNVRYPFGTAGIDQDRVAYVSRYDIADFGIPRGNIASSVVNFLGLSEMFASELASAGQTVSLDGYAGDLAAAQLNKGSLNHFAGVDSAFTLQAEQHREGFEQGAEMIRMLLEDDKTPRNKIQNKID
jgi:hypothetical protein